jgi:P27 family predicted phage terminase small subunit
MPRERIALDQHNLQGTRPQYVERESVVEPGRPKFPKGATPETKRFFKRLSRMLEARRTLTPGDEELLRLAAILRDRHQRACARVQEQGEIVAYTRLDAHGEPHDVVKPNLWLKIAQESEKSFLACLDRLGLTPANRGKVKPTKEPVAPPADAFPTREEACASPEPDIDLNAIDEGRIQ